MKARIAAFAGIQSTTFADQSTSFDMKGALELLARMEREVATSSRTRYAATRKGV